VLKLSGAGIGVAGLAGCVQNEAGDNSGGDTNDGSGGDATSTSLESVNFGFLVPKTGPINALGKEMEMSINQAVDHLNSDTGITLDFEINSAVRDTEGDVSTGVQQANRLVSEDDADIIVGPINSAISLAISDWAMDEEIVCAPTSSSLSLTGSDCNEYTFRAETHSGQVAAGGSKWIVDNLGTDVWFHILDYAYGQSVREEWGKRLESMGATIVDTTAAEAGTTNFEPFISQIRDADPDVVVLGSAGSDLYNFMGQAAQQGLTQETNLFGDSSIVQLTRRSMESAAVGTYGMARFNANFDNDRMSRFVSAWQDRTGRVPGNFSRTAYQTVTMLAQCIQQAGTVDGPALKDAIPGTSVDTFFGDNRFRECDHQAVNPVWVAEFVSSGEDLPDIEYHQYIPGEEAIPPCGETGCDLS
jgi:branched-chain amino acid transport system substrate-binding protein